MKSTPAYQEATEWHKKECVEVKGKTRNKVIRLDKKITPEQRRASFARRQLSKTSEKNEDAAIQNEERKNEVKIEHNKDRIEANRLRNKETNEALCDLAKCDLDTARSGSRDADTFKKAVDTVASNLPAFTGRGNALLKTQTDLQKRKKQLSPAARKQLEAQGIDLEKSAASIAGREIKQTIEANEELMNFVSWEVRKEEYNKSRAQLSSLYFSQEAQAKDGKPPQLEKKTFELIVNAMMEKPHIRAVIADKISKGDSEMKRLLTQYEKSPTHGEWTGYLILQKALSPQGVVKLLQSDSTQSELTAYQKSHRQQYQTITDPVESNTRNLTRNYVREHLLRSIKPSQVNWIDLEKEVLADKRLTEAQKSTLIANFYDSIFNEAGLSPRQYLDSFIDPKTEKIIRADYHSQSVDGIVRAQAQTRDAAKNTPIKLLPLPDMLDELPPEYLKKSQELIEKSADRLAIWNSQLQEIAVENFLEQTIESLNVDVQTEVTTQLIKADPSYAQTFIKIQERRELQRKELLPIEATLITGHQSLTAQQSQALLTAEVGTAYPISQSVSWEIFSVSEQGQPLIVIPRDEPWAIVLTPQEASSQEAREKIHEFMEDLRLLYLSPTELLKVTQCWNDVIREGGSSLSPLDLTNGIDFTEQRSRDAFWDFVSELQPSGNKIPKRHDASLLRSNSEESATTTEDEQIREALLWYTSQNGIFDREGLREKMKTFFTQTPETANF